MEAGRVRPLDTRARSVRVGWLAALLLALAVPVWLAAAQGGAPPPITCPPPGGTICSGAGDGGGGSNPPGLPGPPSPPGSQEPPPAGGGGADDPPPSGGGGTPAPPGASCQSYHWCAELYLCPELADLVVDNCGGHGDWLVSYSCRSLDSCTAAPEPPAAGPPCDPWVGSGSWSLACSGWWGYQISVQTSVPPHRALRSPFPRGLVTEPNTLALLPEPAFGISGGPTGSGGAGGFWSQSASIPFPLRTSPEPGDVKELQIGLRWRRLHAGDNLGGQAVPPTCWTFDERSWNLGQDFGAGPVAGSACGTTVSHAYETASYDRPANGPRLDLDSGRLAAWDLESYQVLVPTYWAGEWNLRWWSWEQVGTTWGDCFCRAEGEPLGIPHQSCGASQAGCDGCGGWCGRLGEPRYEWVRHEEGWHVYDLRQNGLASWYYVSLSVQSGGLLDGVEHWGPALGSVPVPVIEVQSVIQEP